MKIFRPFLEKQREKGRKEGKNGKKPGTWRTRSKTLLRLREILIKSFRILFFFLEFF